jgi:hypothetical protein
LLSISSRADEAGRSIYAHNPIVAVELNEHLCALFHGHFVIAFVAVNRSLLRIELNLEPALHERRGSGLKRRSDRDSLLNRIDAFVLFVATNEAIARTTNAPRARETAVELTW